MTFFQSCTIMHGHQMAGAAAEDMHCHGFHQMYDQCMINVWLKNHLLSQTRWFGLFLGHLLLLLWINVWCVWCVWLKWENINLWFVFFRKSKSIIHHTHHTQHTLIPETHVGSVDDTPNHRLDENDYFSIVHDHTRSPNGGRRRWERGTAMISISVWSMYDQCMIEKS